MLKLYCPNFRIAERQYVAGVIFETFLGIRYKLIPYPESNWCLTDSENVRCLIMPDAFFQKAHSNWLNQDSLPEHPLPVWNVANDLPNLAVTNPELPIISGHVSETGSWLSRPEESIALLGLDVLGSAFFMLTRYEELIKQDRDEHDRFPSWASLSYQEGFISRPIVDEYVEVLWVVMQRFWPRLMRKQREFSIKLSHDVDSPSRYGFKSPWKLIRALGGSVIKRRGRNLESAIRGIWIRLNTKEMIHPEDPVNTFEWIMDVSEYYGLVSAFYFICGRTNPLRDGEYDLEHPAIRTLMRRIHERGHEIGLHPSYSTYKDPDLIAKEAARLRMICEEERIEQSTWGGRMHYLRWQNPVTMRGWEKARMTYDNSLAYADYAGFRCGTCCEYPAFDVEERRQLTLRLRPLIVMEGTVLSSKYMGIDRYEAALQTMEQLKAACRVVRGSFTLLWHNTQLSSTAQQLLYKRISRLSEST